MYAKLDPQRAELHFHAGSSYGLWQKSFKQSSCYLRQFREHTNKRTKDLKTSSVFPTEASKERHTDKMGCCFLEGLVLPTQECHCCVKTQQMSRTRPGLFPRRCTGPAKQPEMRETPEESL